MLPNRLVRFPTGMSGLLTALTVRWGYFHGNAIQINIALTALLPLMLAECPNLSRFLSPSLNTASQVAAYELILQAMAPSCPGHKMETVRHLDGLVSPYIGLAVQADTAESPVYAETRAFMLKGEVEARRMVVATAPQSASGSSRNEGDAPATQRVLTTLVELRSAQFMVELHDLLREVWNEQHHHPIEVFERALASRSLTCVAILFNNLQGVKEAGPVYSILEHAAQERATYFAFKLATPEGEAQRPDHTCWFTYTSRVDECVRAHTYEAFAKINLFELGAQIRKLREKVRYDSSMWPRPGQEFLSDSFLEHLHLLGYLSPWIAALGFDLMGKASFLEMLRIFSVFCQRGLHYRGQPRETHKRHLHELYLAFLADLYKGFKPFRDRRLLSYTELAPFDSLYPQTGSFTALIVSS